MTWFKLFSEFAADPKVQTMSEAMQRRLVMLYCLCCTEDPPQLEEHEIAAYMRISLKDWRKTQSMFLDKGFIEEDGSVPNFEARQGPTDPTATARQHRHREKLRREAERNGHRDVTKPSRVTSLVTDTRTRNAERKREGEREKSARARRDVTAAADGEEQTDAITDAPYLELVRYAEEVGGPEWPAHVHRLVADGYPPGWIREAIAKGVSRNDLRPVYIAGILGKYLEQGGTDREVAGPRREPPAGGQPPPPDIAPPPFIPSGPEGDAIRAMFEPRGKEPKP